MSITWTPGAPPDGMKDGREVILWSFGPYGDPYWSSAKWVLGSWWVNHMTRPLDDYEASRIAAWSEINPPEVTP